MGANSKMQICESCKGKYSVDLAVCPHCHHKSNLKEHTQGAKMSLEQERAIIGAVGGVLLGATCLLAIWVFKYQGAEIEYRVLGRKDFRFTVTTKVLRRDGNGLRLAGNTTYWSKPGRLRLDLISAEDPTGRPLTRLARLGDGQMYTVDTAAGICFAHSYSPEALQAPSVSGSPLSPAAWTPASQPQTMFSLLGNSPQSEQGVQVQLIQSPTQTPALLSGPTRSYKLETFGRKNVNGFSTIHYRLTTTVSSKGCPGLGNGQEVTDYWVVPNLNGRFFEEEPAEAKSGGSVPENRWDDESAAPTATPDPQATPTSAPVAVPQKTGSTPLPVPTPYSPATTISTLRPSLALMPTPPDACAVDNLRSGEESDFQNLFQGFIVKLRQYNGRTLVMEQEVKKFKRLQLSDDVFSVARYSQLDASSFWAKRAAPLPKAATPKT